MSIVRTLVLLTPLLGLACSPPPQPAASAEAPIVAAATPNASATASAPDPEAILARSDLGAYHGWIEFLAFEARHAGERLGTAEGEKAQARLREWTTRILANPNVLGELRGVQEWAYESPADGSGQPFKVSIPTDYDPQHPAPVLLYMHGFSGNHLEHSVGMQDHPGYFEVSVLGRSRGGFYVGLSEADVLQVLDYLQANWAIDLDQVHLTGGSMGGHGTFWLGSRYPQRFASGRPVCGNASDKPLGNLLTLPIYATHSDDDWTVPVLHSRGPLAKLKALGAPAIYDETTGLGHAAWDYTAGNERGRAWEVTQKRPDSRSIQHLDFTALDGTARRAWWAEVLEWGAEPTPARFVLDQKKPGMLRARLSNVRRLELRLSESPFDVSKPLRIEFEGKGLWEGDEKGVPAPITIGPISATDRLILDIDPVTRKVKVETAPPATPFRLHTPGGANQVYDGSPLLIVYGTSGSDAVRRALEEAANVASRGSRAEWLEPMDDKGKDGVPHNLNLYGALRIKPDTLVTPEDIATRQLVLIGTAAQNAVVARIASQLPVSYSAEAIHFDDGLELPSVDRALGLVHYNPEAPTHLIFWVAATDARAYAAGSLVPALLGARNTTGADAVVTSVDRPALVLARSFDSRWHWHDGRSKSPLLPSKGLTGRELGRAVAESVRRATGADFAVAAPNGSADDPGYAAGFTRLSDLRMLAYFAPLSVMRISGAELAGAGLALAMSELSFQPTLGVPDAKRSYRVALTPGLISAFAPRTHLAPRDYQVTDLTLADALRGGIAVP